jgi:hypothetical protein
MKLTGNCFCGAVELEVSGSPEAMGYCHCRSCRSWSGGPVNAFSLWKPKAVRVTRGAECVAVFQKSPLSERHYCARCGGHLMTNHPPLGLIDIFAATIPDLDFKPALHVNYAEIEGFSRRIRRIGGVDPGVIDACRLGARHQPGAAMISRRAGSHGSSLVFRDPRRLDDRLTSGSNVDSRG